RLHVLTRLEVFRQSCKNPAPLARNTERNGAPEKRERAMQTTMRWLFGVTIAFLVIGVPIVRYRWVYTHSKRLREVTPGVFYRSGAMTASGFKEAVDRYHIRTIVNLQDEFPDPDVDAGYFTLKTMKESKLCHHLGVRYVFIPPQLV